MKLESVILLITLVFITNTHAQTEQKTPTEILREFWSLVLEGKTDKAIADSTLKNITDEKNIRAEIEIIKTSQPQITGVLVEKVEGSIAEIEVESKDKDGAIATYSSQFFRDRATNQWKIIFILKRFTKTFPSKILRDAPTMPFRNVPTTDLPINLNVNCPKCS
jgi:hypothetical protein